MSRTAKTRPLLARLAAAALTLAPLAAILWSRLRARAGAGAGQGTSGGKRGAAKKAAAKKAS